MLPIYLIRGVTISIKTLWVGTVLSIAMLMAPYAAAATGPGQTMDSGEKNRLILCIASDVDSLDPTDFRSRTTQIVLNSIFDSLTTRDSFNGVIPQLADSWRLINDTLWQFKLRKGVRFHNGDRLSAADVKFTLDRVVKKGGLDGRSSPRKSLFEPIFDVSVVDDLTVHIKTRYPWPNLPLMLSLQPIVPAGYIQTVGIQEFKNHPVGSGPFRLVSSDPGKELRLERFKDYYGGSDQQPPVQTTPIKYLIFKVVPSQLDQMVMLKTGRCDIIFNIPPESIPILEMSPGVQIIKVPPTKSYFAEINCTKPPFDDVRVRHSLNFAVDIQAVVRHKLQGYASALATVLLPNAFGYDHTLEPYPYEPARARKLLAASAYPYNRPIAIHCNRDDLAFAHTIALFLTKLGLKARVSIAPNYRPKTSGPDAPWDIFVGSWGNSTLDPVGILIPKFRSHAYGNYSGYSCVQVDDLMMRTQSTMDDARRADGYRQIQKIIFRDAPMIFGYAPDEFYAVAKRVKNFVPPDTGMIDLRDVYVKEDD